MGITTAGDLSHAIKAAQRLTSLNIRSAPETMYSRTQNDNGSFNTRCLDCFMTIASYVETQQELDRVEAHHICPEKALSELLAQEKAIQEHAARN